MELNSPERFKEEDKEKVVEFLNFVAKNAKFSDLAIPDVIKFYGLLSFCQQTLLKKINSHIVDSIKIHTPPEPEPKKSRAKSKAS
jgi:hypothetical protein